MKETAVQTPVLRGLVFDAPAATWSSALPLGNGHIGAMVYGGTDCEKICLNDDTLWSGSVHETIRPNFRENLERVRALMGEGRKKEAQELLETKMFSEFTQAYMPLGTLDLRFSRSAPEDFRRTLDYATATAHICARGLRRSCFVSQPHDVMVYTLESDAPMDLAIDLSSELQAELQTGPKTLQLTGRAPNKLTVENVYYFREGNNEMRYDRPEEAIHFCALLQVETDGVLRENRGLQITGATKTVLYYTSATSFREQDEQAACAARLQAAVSLGAEALCRAHLEDVRSIFGAVSVNFGDTDAKTTPELMKSRDLGAKTALLFQHGRYLLMACSRAGTMPANLQGIWNKDLLPAWWSNYTLNINLEMNYWPVWKANLAPCFPPLLDFMEYLREKGRPMAEAYGYHGFTIHHQTDIWGLNTPVGYENRWYPDSACWGMWNLSTAWLCTQLLDAWRYTKDPAILKRVYSLMTDVDAFLQDWMISENGVLQTLPSTSPENSYHDSQGNLLAICKSSTMDLEILSEFYQAFEEAATASGDPEKAAHAADTRRRLAPIEILPNGRLMEWDRDYEEHEPGHRHFSMLYGVFPGSLLLKDEKLRQAAIKSFRHRLDNGGGNTGWSAAWAILLAARLEDPRLTESAIRTLFDEQFHPNLFGAHPVNYTAEQKAAAKDQEAVEPYFQIDANFGFTAAICEILLQEYGGVLYPLKTLPSFLQEGTAAGLICAGGHRVDLSWTEKTYTITLTGAGNDTLQLSLPDKPEALTTVSLQPGESCTLSGIR